MSSETGAASEAPIASDAAPSRFTVKLTNFEGPFDLLLQLIGKHKLDVTEIALSRVTDEFIAHLRALGDQLDLDQASEFLVIASTLLDLKAARLLPAADVEDEDDLELLEARDLLFARLLQYKAYKQAARFLREREAEAAQRYPRAAALEPRFADLAPEVVLDLSPEAFARLAARVLAPKAPEVVSVSHLHAPPVSVSEQLLAIRNHLVRSGTATFRALTADCGHTLEVVARFLALLELYRQQRVVFEQLTPLGELHVRWTGGSVPDDRHSDDVDGAVGDAADAAADVDEEYG
ncbi:segregation and condensation protein A [Blastococcus haudaquaticus]|uniref:Segregation and condensation protein A n=1 Tax=Blastococcus haudaquaticus TaxID=1938745 RepID=A0A286GQ00_9ACTN|nr:ScpA family protein [Blastococcus haudaquaticus]SOD97266.1 condensin subunit ScpA [Blastococcus haudaquaticus]